MVAVVSVVLAASRAVADEDPCRWACTDYIRAASACPHHPLAEARRCVCDDGLVQELRTLCHGCEVVRHPCSRRPGLELMRAQSKLPFSQDIVDAVPQIYVESVVILFFLQRGGSFTDASCSCSSSDADRVPPRRGDEPGAGPATHASREALRLRATRNPRFGVTASPSTYGI